MTKIVFFNLVDLLFPFSNDNPFVTTRDRSWAFQLSLIECATVTPLDNWLAKFEFLVNQFRMRNGNKCPCLLLQSILGVSILL